MKNIVFITDTWSDHNINGVVTWLTNIKGQLEQNGFQVAIIHPNLFFNFPLPTYPELKMAFFAKNKLEYILLQKNPDYIHISTEGPLGLAALRVCLKNKWHFSTFYHTRLPEYISLRLGMFEDVSYSYFRWFHNKASSTMVGANSIKEILNQKNFKNLILVPLGIDLKLFKKNYNAKPLEGLRKPIFVYSGRIAPEKNLEAFLKCDLPGSKLLIGKGPSKERLENKYKTARFIGYKKGQELVDLLSASDVFVFPSKTDTFGLAVVEALACGLPVAAYDVAGPKDIITDGKDGFLGENLGENAKKCLHLDSNVCMEKSKIYSWVTAAKVFVDNSVFK